VASASVPSIPILGAELTPKLEFASNPSGYHGIPAVIPVEETLVPTCRPPALSQRQNDGADGMGGMDSQEERYLRCRRYEGTLNIIV